MPPKPLAERVKMASHVFAGTAQEVWVADKDGKKLTEDEEPKLSGYNNQGRIEISVRVDESLRPSDWHPKSPIKVHYDGGYFWPKEVRARLVGKKCIYLISERNSAFRASYGSSLTEPLETKSDVQELIKSQSK